MTHSPNKSAEPAERIGAANSRSALRLLVCGAADAGKSTLLGRLCDGLQAGRGQGSGIDLADRYFATPRRAFIAADIPGDERHTRNIAAGAANAVAS